MFPGMEEDEKRGRSGGIYEHEKDGVRGEEESE